MQTNVLLSIKPEFAEKILAGRKRYEFRRVLFKSQSVSRIIIYASSPVRKIVGEFEVAAVLAMARDELWTRTRRYSGIEKRFFDEYFRGRCTCFAIQVKGAVRYTSPVSLRHLCPSGRPPQSFMYLSGYPSFAVG